MIYQLQLWILKLNETFIASSALINFLTGVIVVVTILSMNKFNDTPSAAFKYTKLIYYTACVSALLGIGINRLIGYPPEYPLSSLLYLIAYLAFTGYMLYAGSEFAHRSVKYGKPTISTTQNRQSLS